MKLTETYQGIPLDGVHDTVLESLIEKTPPNTDTIHDVFTGLSDIKAEQLAIILMNNIVQMTQEIARKPTPVTPNTQLYSDIVEDLEDTINTDLIYATYHYMSDYPWLKGTFFKKRIPTAFTPELVDSVKQNGTWADVVICITLYCAIGARVSELSPALYAHYCRHHNNTTAVQFLNEYAVQHYNPSSTVKWKEDTFATRTQKALSKKRVLLARNILEFCSSSQGYFTDENVVNALRATGFTLAVLPGYPEWCRKGVRTFGGDGRFYSAIQSNIAMWDRFRKMVWTVVLPFAFSLALFIGIVSLILASAPTNALKIILPIMIILWVMSLGNTIVSGRSLKLVSPGVKKYTIGPDKEFYTSYNVVTGRTAGEKNTRRKWGAFSALPPE